MSASTPEWVLELDKVQGAEPEGHAIGVLSEPGGVRWPSPEQVRAHTEAALAQVMAVGEVAQGMWRLLLADRSRHRVAPIDLGQWRSGVLPKLAARDARQRIDAVRQRQESTLDVYVLASFAGALATTGDSDAAALALLDLAWLHLLLGYPTDALRLIQAADTEDVSERMHALLARAGTSIAAHAQHLSDVSDVYADHDYDGEPS